MIPVLETGLKQSLYVSFLDIHNVKKVVNDLNKDELKDLYQTLGLSEVTVLNKYSGSVSEYAEDLIRSWILEKDDVLNSKDYGRATWENLKKALTALRFNGTAEKINNLFHP